MRFYPFVFTGKERDEETGYGYFGARYMDHELMTGWLSIDPMADKYPSISPYAYCAWNPIRLIDPDGREVDESGFFDKNGNVKCKMAYDAFRFFAKTTFGHRAIALFAKGGQTIAGQKFTEDGLFHKAGIDLAFDVTDDMPNLHEGDTGPYISGSGKSERMKLKIRINPSQNSIASYLETICHEMFFHAFNFADDYMDDKEINDSQIPSDLRRLYANDRNAMHEYQDMRDGHRYRNYTVPIMAKFLGTTEKKAMDWIDSPAHVSINMSKYPQWRKR